MYISGRERRIIEQLLSMQEVLTVKELAELLGVSERTIHRDLKNLEYTITDFHLKLSKKSGSGISIRGKKEDKQQLQSFLKEEAATDYTPEERKAILLFTLLEMKEPVKLFTLAKELQVTNATISSELDQLEEELSSYGLIIIRKKGSGIKIEGNEAQKRSALSNLITQYFNPFGLIPQLKEDIQNKSKQRKSNRISSRLIGLVNPEMLEIIEKRVEIARDELPYKLADSGYIGLVVHSALAIERLKKGDVIQFDPLYLKKIQGTKEYEIAKRIIQDLEESLSIDIPNDDIGYITMHLMGAKLRSNHNYLIEDSSLNIAYKAKELIHHVSEQMKEDFTENNKLLNDLIIHLKPAIFRLKQGMTIKNPMIKEIKRDYDVFFHIIRQTVNETFADLEFPDDEIGYLVLHFAATMLQVDRKSNLKALVICSSGIGSSKILATKLMQKIPEIKLVENKSVFDLKAGVTKDYDIVVSTIPLKEHDEEYILTSPMLTESETRRIQKEIRKKALAPKKTVKLTVQEEENNDFLIQLESIHSHTKAMVEILNHFHVKQVLENSSIPDILESICIELEESKIISNKKAVLTKLLKRAEAGGLGIPNTYLSLYHTRSDDVIVPTFTIYSLNHPLNVRGMDGENMPINRILLMLAPEGSYPEVLEVFSYLSSLIIQGQGNIQLFETGNEKRIKQFLSEKFHEFIKEKI